MSKSPLIASITVATNAAAVLPKQIDALLRQSRSVDEVIVVDNGSTDETVVMLRNRYPKVTIIELGRNLGVGGALAAGLSYALLEKKHDWAWLLDDDSVPQDDAVEKLLSGYDLSRSLDQEAAVVAAVPFTSETQEVYPGLLWRERFVTPTASVVREPIWFVDATISSGTMIRRDVVENVGLPRSDFFMDFVDFEYSLRIRRQGYRICMVRDSILLHTIGTPRVFQFLGYKRAWSDHAPWRQYYIMRNHAYVIWNSYPKLRPKLYLVGRLLQHGAAILCFSEHKKESFSMMIRGFRDGLLGRLGARFLPDIPQQPITTPKRVA
jgi:rhamnosyltransferase